MTQLIRAVLTPNGLEEIPFTPSEIAEHEAQQAALVASALPRAKEAKNAQINEWRILANRTTFNHNGYDISCDDLSRSDLDGLANYIGLTGQFPPGFQYVWKTASNDFIGIPAVQDFKDMYRSMVVQGNTNFLKSEGLKQQLAACTTVEQVNLINW